MIDCCSLARSLCLATLFALGGSAATRAASPVIELPGDRAFPESITSAPDGTLYVSSLASGGVFRVRPEQSQAEPWIKPGAYDSRSTFGVLADMNSHTLWVCSNDASALGVPGPSSVKGSFLKGFDLRTGEGKISTALPGPRTLQRYGRWPRRIGLCDQLFCPGDLAVAAGRPAIGGLVDRSAVRAA